MLEIVDGFDWDEGNSTKCWNCIPKEDIEYLFTTKNITVLPDMIHSNNEDRYIAIGVSSLGEYMFIVFTLRSKNNEVLIRHISARYMREKEVKKYGQSIS